MNGCRLRSRHRERRQAIHAAEPEVSSAIEGGKILGWVRYHHSRLAGSVDAMELYDLGDNVEIVRSFKPRADHAADVRGCGAFQERRLTIVQADVRGLSSFGARRDRSGTPRLPLAAEKTRVRGYSKLRHKIR
jgi:hypothetical protein